MLRLAFTVVVGSTSAALGFAGLGLALYANGPALSAAVLFGTVGAAAGLACAALHAVFDGLPQPRATPVPGDELARLVRVTLGNAATGRARGAGRPGTAADRKPAQPALADKRQFSSSAFGA